MTTPKTLVLVDAGMVAGYRRATLSLSQLCAPAGALDGTLGFLERAARRALAAGSDVVAFTDRALPGVALGRLRNEGGRWLWDMDGTRTIAAADVAAATSGAGRRRRSR